MGLEAFNGGKGFIGEVGSRWQVTQNGSPNIVGMSPGRLGGLSFNARCDETSIFTIDDYLTVRHYDDAGNLWMDTFDGYIRGLSLADGFGGFSMVSKLSALDVERRTSVNTSGTYQRKITLPQMDYEILGTPYTTPANPTIYDMSASGDEHYTYVLAEGGHAGEVVFIMGMDGVAWSVWPVYSDATDLASPQSRVIANSSGSVLIGQTGAKRVKRFSASDGTFSFQFGSSGTGDGQFQSINGIAYNTAFNSIFVSDFTSSRVQRFSLTGVYANKWGVFGTGSGSTVMNGVNRLAVTQTGDHVFVSDRLARIREYDSFGNLQSTPFGEYDFTTQTSVGEFSKTADIMLDFDSNGHAYAAQNGTIFKYVHPSKTGTWPTGTLPVQSWQTRGNGPVMCITKSGIMHVGMGSRDMEQWSASVGTLKAYILYIIALAVPDFKIRMLVINEPFPARDYIAWKGNVWGQLCDLMAMTRNRMFARSDTLVFSDMTGDVYTLPDDAEVVPVELDSRAAGRSIQITSQNTKRVGADAASPAVYDAEVDNNRTFSVDTADLTYVTLSQNAYVEYIFPILPTSSYPVIRGRYIVTDKNGLTVNPTLWTNYGGLLSAAEGDNPGEILLTITGPGLAIPGYEAPYVIGTASGQAALRIKGTGIMSDPEMLTIGTGVSEDVAPRSVAQTIDSYAVTNTNDAYSAGAWVAYNSGTPNQRVSITQRLDKAPKYVEQQASINGISRLIGNTVFVRGAQYVIEDLTYNESEFTLTCYRYSEVGLPPASILNPPRFEEIWSGRPAGEFDAFWAGYLARDVTIAPLMNPYGV